MRISNALLIAIVASLPACMTGPRPVHESAGPFLEGSAPAQVWVTLVDGSRLIIQGPRVISDTVFGFAEGEEIAIPVSDLKELRARKFSLFKSTVMPTLLMGGAITAFVLTRHPEGLPPEDPSQTCEDTGGICPEP